MKVITKCLKKESVFFRLTLLLYILYLVHVTEKNDTKFTQIQSMVLYRMVLTQLFIFLVCHLGYVNSGKAIENPSTESIETVANHSRQRMRRNDEETGIASARGDQRSKGKGQGRNDKVSYYCIGPFLSFLPKKVKSFFFFLNTHICTLVKVVYAERKERSIFLADAFKVMNL